MAQNDMSYKHKYEKQMRQLVLHSVPHLDCYKTERFAREILYILRDREFNISTEKLKKFDYNCTTFDGNTLYNIPILSVNAYIT